MKSVILYAFDNNGNPVEVKLSDLGGGITEGAVNIKDTTDQLINPATLEKQNQIYNTLVQILTYLTARGNTHRQLSMSLAANAIASFYLSDVYPNINAVHRSEVVVSVVPDADGNISVEYESTGVKVKPIEVIGDGFTINADNSISVTANNGISARFLVSGAIQAKVVYVNGANQSNVLIGGSR